jgi:hypothetical protein
MANPNIVSVTSILGVTTYLTPSVTTAISLLNNPASSNKVFKIESLVASNNTGSAATCTVSYYTAANVQGTNPPTGGTAFPICTSVSVPANASLVVIEKSNGIYLMENACISVTSGTGSAITYTVSYEDIS